VGWVHTVYNITAAGAVDREFIYIWGPNVPSVGRFGVPWELLGCLLELLGESGGSLWAALECLMEMLIEMEPLT
jgi:hypothetical protein